MPTYMDRCFMFMVGPKKCSNVLLMSRLIECHGYKLLRIAKGHIKDWGHHRTDPWGRLDKYGEHIRTIVMRWKQAGRSEWFDGLEEIALNYILRDIHYTESHYPPGNHHASHF